MTTAPPQVPTRSAFTSADADALRRHLGDTQARGILRPLSARRDALRRLFAGLVKHEKALHAALYTDLRKSELEAYMAETGFTRDELKHTLSHLGSWASPKRVLAPLAHQPAWGWVHRVPLGTVLIIAPWNYPVQLALSPLVCALAGGNTAVIKPSELTPNVSDALAALIKDTFSPDEVRVVAGGVAETTALLEQPWDHIFFTGSTQVGQIVYRAAAETMSPVTLELGGKSPAIIAEDAPLALTARRLVWGKFANAGQTCVAPDYLLVPEGNVAALVSELKREIEAQFGANPQASPDYGRLVNERNFHRVAGYLAGGRVAHGGQHDAADKYLAPTVLTDVDLDHAVMQDEIFGPVLPIIPYKSLSDALAFTNARPKPLASYVFTQSGATERAVVEGLNAGGTLINDTLLHLANGNLPFGGVGTSGIGQYHGRFGFETFTRPRGVMKKPFWLDQFVRYAPVKDWQVKLSRWFIG
jgi:aldehyde dehydrogenase (NAD+)